MNIKPALFLSCLVAIPLISTAVTASPHPGGGGNFGPVPVRGGGGSRPLGFNGMRAWNGQHWNGHYWSGNRWSNNWNWHHNHHHFNNAFFVDFGFPFWSWWSYPWYYGYYPNGYPYGYFGYGNRYYGNSGYGYGNSYGNGSNVADLQRKLADAGYYHGSIDGVMGPRTQSALRAYRSDQGNGNNTGHGYSPTLRDRPYSPPPITTEPSPGE